MAGLNLRWRGASADAPASPTTTASGVSTASLTLWLTVATIVLLALAARAYNLSWDEGTHVHPDERHLTMVSIELELPSGPGEYFDTAESRLNPYNLENSGSFVYGTLPVFLNKALAVFFGQDTYDDLVIVGRQLTALFAAATVLFVFLSGRRLYGTAAGLLAAVLFAAAPLAIQHAHFFVVDTYLAFFMAAAFYFAVRVMQEGAWSDYAFAGLMLGLAMACKVTGVLFLPVLLAAAAFRLMSVPGDQPPGTQSTLRPYLGMALALLLVFVAFRVAQPYAFDGVFSLNDRWVQDQQEQERLISGEVGFPPSVQWIDRSSYFYPLQEMVLWGTGPAFGIAAWAAFAYAGYRLLRYQELLHLLPLLFVLAYFGFMGSQFSLYLRYFLPLYPVLAVMAGWGLVELYRAGGALGRRFNRPWLEHAAIGGVALVVAGALLAGLAYTSIYSRDFTRAEGTRWLWANAPQGAAIAGEEWDETLPVGLANPPDKRFEVFGLALYPSDSAQKFEALIDGLDRADYVVVSSNRLVNSLPRNRINYPLTSRYHEMLLNGDLGFELASEFTSYPGLFGIEVPDHHVQESWSSYDHPRVLIFEKAGDYSRQRLEEVLGNGPFAAASLTPAQAQGNDLLLSESELETQRQGGTWTDVFSTGGIAGSNPALVWFLALQVAALAVTPLALSLFRRLPDSGYLLSKPLGLLLLAYLTWLPVSLKLVPFQQATVIGVLAVLAAAGVAVAFRRRDELWSFVRERWRMILFSELLFLGAFLLFYFLRLENPDLWHPFRGGEKPMDLAYLTAVARSTTLPPYDPWFAGGYINYYYLGQFFTATLLKLTTITPEVGYNLAIPTYFSLTVAAAFSVAYNLAAASRRLLSGRVMTPATTGERVRVSRLRSAPAWSLYAAGMLGVFLVAIAGNLDGVGQLVERLSEVSAFHLSSGFSPLDSVANSFGGAWQVLVHGADLRGFDFWRSSRMLPPTISITEFPFFSFLFADLHAHMMAIAFQVLTIAACLALALRGAGERDTWRDVGLVVLLGLVVGSLRWLNSWDYPPFLLLALAAVLISERHLEGGTGAAVRRALLKGALLVVLSFLFYQPFLDSYRTPVAGLTSSPEQTPVHQYLAHFGVFAAVIATGLLVWLARAVKGMRLGNLTSESLQFRDRLGRQVQVGLLLDAVVVVAIASLLLAAIGQPLVAALLPVLALVVALAVREVWVRRPDGGLRLFVLALIGLGLGLSMGVDIVILEGDIVRMNTVFKFYLHAWVVFALAASYLAWQLVFVFWRPLVSSSGPRMSRLAAKAGVAGLAALLMGAALYPLLATPVRLNDRFNELPAGLDGMAYMEQAVYNDEHGPIDLSVDREGIEWMRRNVEGTPVIVEGQAELYRWGGRFSIYTGLPSVVGWDWHQRQQRGDLAFMVTKRGQEVTTFYNSPDVAAAVQFLALYDVRYVIVGQVERYYYEAAGLEKFEGGMGRTLEVAFENDGLTIYRVVPEQLASLAPGGR